MICSPNRGEPMCDHDGCAVLGNSIKGCLYDLFAANVDGAGRLVQYQDFGFFHDASSDGKALSLTAT
jgi:hypothetical protein